jgi:anaerobic selenocysteine-containing dehydrogenase
VSWDTALSEIAGTIDRLRRDPGPQSILYYAASGTKGLLNAAGETFWRMVGGYTTTYGDLCWPAGLEATRLTLGDNKHSAPWDIEHARLIVLWGKNAAETNIHQMVFIDRALDAGAELVVIDPRRTQTAERASLLIQPRPGTDGALALAVAHRLIASGRIDRPFIERHVHGFDAFAAAVETSTPEWAAEICEIPVDFIERLAELFGNVRPATISAGYGMQRFTNSGQTMRALLALLTLTGNIGKRGAGWVYANLQSQIFDTVRDPLACYPPSQPDGVARVSISTARLGPEMLATDDPPLRMAWVERGNPLPQNPDSNAVRRAFRALDFRVVVDQFLTDTAREADIVLPAKTMFEQSDVIGAYWHDYIQLKRKMIDPPGEVKTETEIYRLLGERLGLRGASDTTQFPVTDAEVDRYLADRLKAFPGLTLERLGAGPLRAPGHQEIAFRDLVFPTASGKIELSSAEAVRRWTVDRLPSYHESAESLRADDSPDAEYPFYLLTPNTKNSIHSQFNNLRMIRQVGPGPAVYIHPADAHRRGIGPRDRVRVFNERGELRLPVSLDGGLRRGCVCVTNGWWIEQGGAVNLCSAARETDMGHGAAFHDNRVQIERIPHGR